MIDDNGLTSDDLTTISSVVNAAAAKSIANTAQEHLAAVEGFIRNIVLERPVLFFMSTPNMDSLLKNHMQHYIIQPWIIDYVGYFMAMMPNNKRMVEALKMHMSFAIGSLYYETSNGQRGAQGIQLAPKAGVLDLAVTETDCRNTFSANIWILALSALNVFGDYGSLVGTINSLSEVPGHDE